MSPASSASKARERSGWLPQTGHCRALNVSGLKLGYPVLIEGAKSSHRSRRAWVAGAAASLLAVGLLFAPLSQGIPKAYDLRDHLGATFQVLKSLKSGDLYPRWLSDFHGGFGEPTLLFYPPGLYLVSAPLSALFGGDVLAGLYAALALFAFAGCLGAFAFVRRKFGLAAGMLAAVVYGLVPFRVFEVYGSGLYSSFAAWSLLPWMLLCLEDCVEETGEGSARPGVAAWPGLVAAMTLTNLPAVVLLLYLAVFWLAARALAARKLTGAFRVLALAAWGAAMAAVHVIPALVEMPSVQILGEELYRGNFLFQGKGSGMTEGVRLTFDRMGLLPAIALAVSLFVLGMARGPESPQEAQERRGFTLLVGLTGSASLFFATAAARWAWELLPVLQKVNLPWRLLEPLSASAACAAAAAAALLRRPGSGSLVFRLAGAALLSIVAVFGAVFDASLTAANGKLTAADCRAAIPQFARKEAYFLPKGARHASEMAETPPLACDQPCGAAVVEHAPSRRRIRVAAQTPVHLAVRTYYFPGWTARVVEGGPAEELPIGAEPGTGRIVVEVPPGDHIIELRFGSTPPRLAGGTISVLALGAWVIWLGARRRRRPPAG
jgi:hypothetical protein